MTKKVASSRLFAVVVVSLVSLSAHGQNELGDLRFTAFGGPAYVSTSSKSPFQSGLSFDQSLSATRLHNVATGYLLEGGYLRPAITSAGTAYFSVDGMLTRYEQATGGRREMAYMPFAVVGYTRLLNTANAANFGIGIDRAISEDRFWLRADVRDEVTIPSGRQNLGFRLGLVFKGTLR